MGRDQLWSQAAVMVQLSYDLVLLIYCVKCVFYMVVVQIQDQTKKKKGLA